MPVRVCIADEHLLVVSGIKSALAESDEIEVVGSTRRGDELLSLVDQHVPDLVLLDHRLSGMDGIACVRLIKERHPQIKVVMLSASEDSARITEALQAGASAYIGKRINPCDLASSLMQIVDGVVYQMSPGLAGAAPAPAPAPVIAEPSARPCDLTDRELTMLAAISRGLSTKAISRELWITEKTVKFHLTNIYRKLGVHNRASAMRYAFDHDLIRQPAVEPLAAMA
jgi:DNA-binding NarL/FixJ family response regulator